MQEIVNGGLGDLIFSRAGKTRRISSWDQTGGNRDWIHFEPKETKQIALVSGSGIVRHIWFTINHRDPLYLRKMVLRAYWDGEKHPSIEAPIGDFFCLGHGINASFQCAAFNTVAHESLEYKLGGGVALNCYFAMPYLDGMQFEIENESDDICDSFYYYIDFDEIDHFAKEPLRFHAHYRQEYPTVVTGGPLASRSEHYWDQMDVPNLTDENNYLILDAEGSGHFVGCNLSIDNRDPMFPLKKFGEQELRTPELTWWGEGDDMFIIDDDTWPPRLHGTGSEDYFTQAWGMHNKSYHYAGVSIHEFHPHHPNRRALTCYRLHILDPILFSKRLRFSIEHGHANLQQNDYSSVAYWYQTEPHKKFPSISPAEMRLPRFER